MSCIAHTMSCPTFLDLIFGVTLEHLNSLDNLCANINDPYYVACVFCKFINKMYVVVLLIILCNSVETCSCFTRKSFK